ncbi:RecA-superfamily ATPase implicated in signal transduction-like protein [Salinarchaeum sp. Harcht-Bsk1]|uniref:ATPase domain-containing protein n=1 Tax=Salinarchaeum sp. Harcht-Bsk1 TaxID=1333523 RepID=UPI0003423628|nr:ATPase domain-containing protein [Salinarchaeum sp. Harcht-Bsk1]AGN01676.1 RecA-superfamily ATPase implicated in signal transduction-like protein [Salinarchaeum sp. Harcht-Bsk1]
MSDESAPSYCDFCRLPRPAGTIEAEIGGERYVFCSTHCRDAMASADRVFTRYHGHRRFSPGVEAIDAVLPQGCPRNAFLLCSAQAGTRVGALQAELVWRALQRDEPAVLVTFQEPPSSVVERFVTLDWNVLPYLESGQLRFVDCFSYRMADHGEPHGAVSPWNTHLATAVAPATERVRDPTDADEIANKLETVLDGDGGAAAKLQRGASAADPGREPMVETGIVVIDSLTEFGSLVQPVQAYDFVKDLRADVCKARFVPVFAGATYGGDAGAFPHDLAYVADGLIDCKLDGEIVADGLVKRMRVRKLDGVLSYQRWIAYEFTAGRGLVPFDPEAQIERAGADAEASDAESEETGTDEGDANDETEESDAADGGGNGDDGSGADGEGGDDDGESGEDVPDGTDDRANAEAGGPASEQSTVSGEDRDDQSPD